MKRRDFLQKTGAACLAAGLPAGCGEDAQGATAELLSAEGAEGLVRVPAAALAAAGGSVRVQAGGHKILLARLQSGEVAAVTWVCTHSGCTVCFEEGAQEFACPCHGSRFTADGRVAQGPASRPLQEYPVTAEGDVVTIDVSSSAA